MISLQVNLCNPQMKEKLTPNNYEPERTNRNMVSVFDVTRYHSGVLRSDPHERLISEVRYTY